MASPSSRSHSVLPLIRRTNFTQQFRRSKYTEVEGQLQEALDSGLRRAILKWNL
jgi:hypothetical protein